MKKNKEILSFLVNIVKNAGNLITDNFLVTQKGLENDLVTDLDVKVEEYLIKKINDNYPNFDIVSEEINYNKNITNNCFVIDPIDGTINFANGLPLWGIQIACVAEFETVAAVIYLPKMNELYYASEDGAYLNDIVIKSSVVPIKNTLYSIDGTNNLPIMEKMRPFSSGRRNLGAACVSMAFVSSGRLHGALLEATSHGIIYQDYLLQKRPELLSLTNRDFIVLQ